jgi:hypothetical protein
MALARDKKMVGFQYCLLALVTALALVAAIAGFNLVVDPYGMYRALTIDGFNAYKPAIFNRVRLYKAFELRRLRPRAIILGSSRTHIGIGCTHPGWGELSDSCYNLGFDGATTREMYAYLVHAQAIRPLQHVVLGLDTYHTTSAPSFVRPDFDPLILRNGEAPAPWYLLTGDLRLLASLDTLRASIKTLHAQGAPEPSWFARDGQRIGDVFFHRPSEDFVVEGPRAYFDKIDRLEVGYQTEGAAPPPGGHGGPAAPAAAPDPNESSLAYVRRLVEFCRARDIALSIVLTPSHAHQLEIAAATGAWPSIENGKRALVTLLADDAQRHPGQAPIPLFDFARYSSITTESLPLPGSRKELHYYWDSSHFKVILGDWMLDRVFDRPAAGSAAPPDFGMSLTRQNIEGALREQRAAQRAYRERATAELGPLQELVRMQRDKPAAQSLVSAAAPVRR